MNIWIGKLIYIINIINIKLIKSKKTNLQIFRKSFTVITYLEATYKSVT